MKADKKGWGLATMIVFMSILLAFLLVTVIMVYNFYRYSEIVRESSQDKSVPVNIDNDATKMIQKYKLYENRLKRNAITYAYSYYLNLDETGQKVTMEEMVEKNIMNILTDPEDDTPCTGYAIVKLEKDAIVSTPYLKCSNYISANYDVN